VGATCETCPTFGVTCAGGLISGDGYWVYGL
jgi:hypothetical protein